MYKLICLLIVVAMTSVKAQQQQYLSIWNSAGCSGGADLNITAPTQNFTSINPQFYRRAEGLWVVENCNATWCGDRLAVSGMGTGCVTHQTPIGARNLSITRMGDVAQRLAQFHLFPEITYRGNATLVSGTTNFTSVMTVNSLFFTGVHSWTTYTGLGFTGTANCRQPQTAIVTRGYGTTTIASTSLQIGSVVYGCGTTASSTVPPVTFPSVGTTVPSVRPSSSIRPNTTTPAGASSLKILSHGFILVVAGYLAYF